MSAPAIVWSAPLFDRSGFAEEARNFILALDRAGFPVRADPFLWHPWQARLTDGTAERIERLLATEVPDRFVHVVHGSPHDLRRHPRAAYAIARTMFETQDAPPALSHCEAFDEIWVPSAFNLETFARAGIDRARLHVMPEPLDISHYDPDLSPLPLQGLEGRFVFLSVFSWHLRKGWDVLVRAYREEFGADEPVALALKFEPYIPHTPSVAEAQRKLRSFLQAELRRDPAEGPPIVLLDLDLSDAELPRLYRAADAYVMASRGEGWGRTYMEAMAMGLPTIGTRAGGNLAFMSDENAYLVDGRSVPVPAAGWNEVPWYRDHHWIEPDVGALRTAMRRVYEDRDESAARGARAREEVLARYGWKPIAALVGERLKAMGVSAPQRAPERARRPRVVWQGDVFREHSFAVVNRELGRALLGTGEVDLAVHSDPPVGPVAASPALAGLVARHGRSPRAPDVHVRHTWPPDLSRPPSGRWVVVQPWEFGGLPRAWVEGLARADEVWVPSRHVREGYLRSGLDPDRVVVIPNGVNPARFHPGVPPRPLPTRKRFRFLFVGGTLFRKGADILLETYLQLFGPDDDVALVVKDMGTDSFYQGQGLGETIRQLQADPRCPEILYFDDPWSHDDLAALYTACHCLVHPYRAEGFGLPIAEAMACGLPVIVPAYGACLDFCDPSVAHLVPALEARLAVSRLGELETVEPPRWGEIDRHALARAMRDVIDRPEEARAMGLRASAKVRREHSWARAADRALARIRALAEEAERTTPGAPRPERPQLSVCLIVRDEAAFLPACLESVRGVADQVVVVDTGSTDGTPEIARALGAEVHAFAWSDDFAAARNESLRHATGDWILVLDGDEALDPASHEVLRRIVGGDELVGYQVRILNYTAPEGTEDLIEHRTLRLFPNHPDLRFAGRDPHAQLQARRPDLAFPIRDCDVTLHHEGYRPQVLAAKGKLARNREALGQAVREAPGDPFHAFNLGLTYHLLGRSHDAERELLRAVALSLGEVAAGRCPAWLVGACQLLALVTYAQERYAETVAHCRQALVLVPGSSDVCVTLGSALLRLGRLEEAEAAYRQALAPAETPESVATDRSTRTWKPLLGLAEVESARGRRAEALAWLSRAHALAPDNATVATAVARASLRLGDAATAQEILAAVVGRDDAPPEAEALFAEAGGTAAPD